VFGFKSTERVPLLNLKKLALATGWRLDAPVPQNNNDAYALLGKLRQAAVDNEIAFWGRFYDRDFAASDTTPLVAIPAEHFLTYEFDPLRFASATNNFDTFTVKLGKSPKELKGLVYRDIHTDRSKLERWIKKNPRGDQL
jgi:hypothetical protein